MTMQTDDRQPWDIAFYVDRSGRCPVTEFLQRLAVSDRTRIARYFQLLHEFGPMLAMPHARHIEGKLWELRPDAYRILYVIVSGRQCVLLHAFRKKTQETPRQEIALALRRLADYLYREGEEDL